MPKPTTTWICDTCGKLINSAEDGWIEWIQAGEGESRRYRKLRLVHHVTASPRKNKREDGCYLDQDAEYAKDEGVVANLPLKSFLGADGLVRLLEIMSEADASASPDFIEMIKRIHTPGYEHARGHFDAAISAGAFEPNTKPGFYWQSDIDATLKHAGKSGV